LAEGRTEQRNSGSSKKFT